jgi:hypothetical protein
MSDFIHLHNHTHYSLQDGACTVDGLINAAKKHNMKSVAITDHGVMYGAAEFYNKAKKAGIKPIIGMEAYIVVDGSRFDRAKAEEVNNKKKSKFTDAEITTALLAGVPKAGIVIVEMWYSYHQELALPWITPFVPDPIQLYMSSVAPLPAAAPPEPTPTP